MRDKRKKPFPDIFLLALKRINNAIADDAREKGEESEPLITPQECLVFEDSIAGVDAARRAGMRVVWIPHPELRRVCRGREMDVLMGRMEKEGEVLSFDYSHEEERGRDLEESPKQERIISEDGWAEMRTSLEDFPYVEYGFGCRSAPPR
jgi:pseudouridine-5'-monophosphatase